MVKQKRQEHRRLRDSNGQHRVCVCMCEREGVLGTVGFFNQFGSLDRSEFMFEVVEWYGGFWQYTVDVL
jgi:hypothetical protein